MLSAERAIELINSCRADRLPFVLEILKTEGYEFSEETLRMVKTAKKTVVGKNALRRAKVKHDWLPSQDEIVLRLREAYMAGVRFNDIAKLAETNRPVLYEYLKGARGVPNHAREDLKKAIDIAMEQADR